MRELAVVLAMLVGLASACGAESESQDGGTADLVDDFVPDSNDGASDVGGDLDTGLGEVATVGCGQQPHTVFEGVTVVDVEAGQLIADRTVVVSGSRICSVDETAGAVVPADAVVVDGSGRFLIPGLADMHIHVNYPDDMLLYVANGVTTVRILWGFDWTLELREQIAVGEVLGPEVFTTGPIMDGYPPYWPGSEVVTTADAAAASVQTQVDSGFDFIKVYTRLNQESYDAIIQTATQLGIQVVGHVPDEVGLEHVLNSGQYSIEHLTGYQIPGKGDALEQLTAQNEVWNCPTIIVYERYAVVDQLHDQPMEGLDYVHPQMRANWKASEPFAPYDLGQFKSKVKQLHDLGALLIAGTDTANPYVIAGFSLHEELELMVEAGLTPAEVLRTATYAPAEHLGILHRAGTVEVGKDADLVLLDGNPLDDIGKTRNRAGVMVKGLWYPTDELQDKLDGLAGLYEEMSNPTLDCELPADYLAPPGDSYGVMKVSGDLTSLTGDFGYLARDIEVMVDGKQLDVDSYSGQAVVETYFGLSYVNVRTYSAGEFVGPGHLFYHYFSAMIPVSTLMTARLAGENLVQAKYATVFVAEMEMKSVGDKAVGRMCPIAASDKETAAVSSFFVCPDANVEFSVGEQLQLAGNLSLTTDPAKVRTALKMDEPCTCFDAQFQAVDCAEFDAL